MQWLIGQYWQYDLFIWHSRFKKIHIWMSEDTHASSCCLSVLLKTLNWRTSSLLHKLQINKRIYIHDSHTRMNLVVIGQLNSLRVLFVSMQVPDHIRSKEKKTIRTTVKEKIVATLKQHWGRFYKYLWMVNSQEIQSVLQCTDHIN